MPDTSRLVTTTVLNTKLNGSENKIPNGSNLVAKTVLNAKFHKVENKIPGHAKYITTKEFNKLTAENSVTRLKQADLVNKTDFDNKLASFKRQITSNKTKHLKVQKKLTKYYNFFLGIIYFTSNDESQNIIVYQTTLDALELRKGKGTAYVLNRKSKGAFNSKLIPVYSPFLNRRKSKCLHCLRSTC